MILVTGGAGYVGSHVTVALEEAGNRVLILDNFSNSKPEVLESLCKILGREVSCEKGDIRDRIFLRQLFCKYDIEAVVHCAGLKAVGESVEKPLLYYENNVMGSTILFEEMEAAGIRNIIFSSSATVYSTENEMPLVETDRLGCTNPYGWSKFMIEQILKDVFAADNRWRVSILRYFNPIGAHKSGLIGEAPEGIPNNLMPYISKVATKKLDFLRVFGNDYDTIDGTGVRDYLHVMDLADGHLKALEYMRKNNGIEIVNLGTGQGTSVLQLVTAFESAAGVPIPFEVVARRAGDIATCFADASKAKELLGWEAQHGINDMCYDAWYYESMGKEG